MMKYGMLCLLLFAGSAWGLNKKEAELFAAVYKEDLATVKKLLLENKSPFVKEKLNINARDAEGYTALLRAGESVSYDPKTGRDRHPGPETVEILRELIKAGADVNVKFPPGSKNARGFDRSESENAAIAIVLEGSSHVADDLLRELLAAGADVSKDNTILFTVLHNHNLSKGKILNLMIQAGAPINVIGSFHEETPLMIASRSGLLSTVKLLIQHHVDLNAQDEQGKTALMHAEYADIVDVLLKAGARPDITDLAGKTAADYHKELDVMTRYSLQTQKKEEKREKEHDRRAAGLIHTS